MTGHLALRDVAGHLALTPTMHIVLVAVAKGM